MRTFTVKQLFFIVTLSLMTFSVSCGLSAGFEIRQIVWVLGFTTALNFVSFGVYLKKRENNKIVEDQFEDQFIEERCLLFFGESCEPHVIVTPDGRYRKVNPAYAKLLGYSIDEFLKKSLGEEIHPEDRERSLLALAQMGQTQVQMGFEMRCLCKDGSLRTISWNSRLVGNFVYAMGRDITDQKILAAREREKEKLVLHAEKMASLGEMAGGVAHEINNPLAIISMSTDRIKKSLEQSEIDIHKFGRSIAAIESTVFRIAKIVSGLKLFASSDTNLSFENVRVCEVIEKSVSPWLGQFQSKEIKFDISYSSQKLAQDMAEVLRIDCHSALISQAMSSLLHNACDAVKTCKERWIRLEVMDLDHAIEISVVDSGQGISPHLREKIMQPFFTTKEGEHGKGLGLSIVKGILNAHGGDVRLDTSSQYTRFAMELPKLARIE